MRSKFYLTSLVEYVQDELSEFPEYSWVIEELNKEYPILHDTPEYIRFIESENANQPGADWQFDTNLVLEETEYGLVVLDLLKNKRIGGIEFVDEIK
jgi:hypothetical protein